MSGKEIIAVYESTANVEASHRPVRRKRMTKAEKAGYYNRLIEDIRTNGPRQPLELAREYGLSEKKISGILAEAFLKGDISPSKLDYSVIPLWNIKSFIEKELDLSNKDLLRLEGDENALLITPVR